VSEKKKTLTAKKKEKKKAIEKKPVKKTTVKAKAKTEKEVKKKVSKKKESKKKKPKELVKLIEKIKQKRKPVFRGRFGKKMIRRKSKEKWSKWRKPRGIDIKRKKEDGAIPSTGYRTEKKIRALHPSGFKEVLVRNLNELNQVNKGFAVRIAAGVGKKKRKEITIKAKELGVKLLNR
jgi:large subunit ribosomal protein L32e